jgi:pyrimidine deaminase RibD-like protein
MKITELLENDTHNQSDYEIRNYKKLDRILSKLCEMVISGQKRNNQHFGMVAACVLDNDNNIVFGINLPAGGDKRVHAEKVAMEEYQKKYGDILEGSIILTTCSPCSESMDEREGESCTDYINNSNVKKVYCGFRDPTQHEEHRNFNLMETQNKSIRDLCKKFASTFLDYEEEQKVGEDYDNMNVTTTDRSYEKDGKFGSVYRSDSIAKDPKTGKQQSMVQWDVKDPTTGKSYTGTNYIDPEGNADTQTNYDQISEDWNKVNHHDHTDGLSRKAVNAYRREHPGSKLKTAVTTKPSKLKKGSKSAKRRASFCARMSGMKKHRAGAKTKRDPDSPINKALRRWHCESIEEMQELIQLGEQYITGLKENFKDGRHPEDKGDSKRYHVPTKSSVSNLRNFAKKHSGRAAELAHWEANMKAGRAKKAQ